MDIYEALEEMSNYLESLSEWAGCDMSDEELEVMGQVEDTIYQFVHKHEPREGF